MSSERDVRHVDWYFVAAFGVTEEVQPRSYFQLVKTLCSCKAKDWLEESPSDLDYFDRGVAARKRDAYDWQLTPYARRPKPRRRNKRPDLPVVALNAVQHAILKRG